MIVRLSDFDRAVILACTLRYPSAYAAVRPQFAARGLDPLVFLNAPANDPEIDVIGRDKFAMIHDPVLPPSWKHRPGFLFVTLAIREIIRLALADGVKRLLLIEDDCVLSPDFDARVATTEIPDDWRFLYFGAFHNWHDTADAGPGLLKLNGSLATHCVGIDRRAFGPFLRLPIESTADNLIGEYLHPMMPSYAHWPSIAHQSGGISAVTGEMTYPSDRWERKGRNWPTE